MHDHYIMTVEIYFQPEQLIFLNESAKDERIPYRQYGYFSKNQAAVKKVVFININRNSSN